MADPDAEPHPDPARERRSRPPSSAEHQKAPSAAGQQNSPSSAEHPKAPSSAEHPKAPSSAEHPKAPSSAEHPKAPSSGGARSTNGDTAERPVEDQAATPLEGMPVPAPVAATAGRAGHADLTDEDLIHRIAPIFKLLRLYSRLEVEGLEKIPEGGAILAANHTGWIGLDYAYAALSVYDARKRIVRGMAHPTWFQRERVASLAGRLGLFEVDKARMRELLRRGELVLIFPEGEKGAFKPERERYLLQEFARGYVRVALASGVPIVPVAIVGGEEANPSSGRIDSYEDLLDLSLPMPQNIFPRPVKWRIRFLDPVRLEGGPERVDDRDYVHQMNERVQSVLQTEIGRLISVRGHPFL